MKQEGSVVANLQARHIGWAGFFGMILLAWVALWAMAQDRAALSGRFGLELLAGLCATDAASSNPGALVAMWAVMSVAMMAPTAVPAIGTWARMPTRASGGAAGTMALVAGYLGLWLAASLGFALVQRLLAGQGLLAPDGASLSPGLNAGLCALAGLYQFSRLKAACLSRCRQPLTFFMEQWRPGLAGALRSGLLLGVVCLGCCWALMLLAFLGGMTSLVWMGVATMLMVMEKLPGLGRHFSRPVGWGLLGAALLFAIQGVLA